MFLMAPAMIAQERLTTNSKPSLETRVTYSVCCWFDIVVDGFVMREEIGVRKDLEVAREFGAAGGPSWETTHFRPSPLGSATNNFINHNMISTIP
jgi:hypothetical protein